LCTSSGGKCKALASLAGADEKGRQALALPASNFDGRAPAARGP